MDTLTPLATTLLCPAVVVTVGYAVVCAVSPYGRCRRCSGTGRTSHALRRVKPCGRCGETGLRLRYGRRLANHHRRLTRSDR